MSEKSESENLAPFPFFSRSSLQHANLLRRLALVQMKLVLGMILGEFSVTADGLQAEKDMEGLQMAVLAPKGGRCLLRFSASRVGVA